MSEFGTFEIDQELSYSSQKLEFRNHIQRTTSIETNFVENDTNYKSTEIWELGTFETNQELFFRRTRSENFTIFSKELELVTSYGADDKQQKFHSFERSRTIKSSTSENPNMKMKYSAKKSSEISRLGIFEIRSGSNELRRTPKESEIRDFFELRSVFRLIENHFSSDSREPKKQKNKNNL